MPCAASRAAPCQRQFAYAAAPAAPYFWHLGRQLAVCSVILLRPAIGLAAAAYSLPCQWSPLSDNWEVREHLIKPELRQTHRDTRCSKGQQLREAANHLRGEGDRNLTQQLGVWGQP